MLPKNVSEADVSALFSQYGTIKELQILRGSQQTSKGILHIWGIRRTFAVYFEVVFVPSPIV